MEITFQSHLINFEFDWEKECIEWLLEVIERENKLLKSLAYNFVGKEEILEINREFLKHDYFTDIITFDSSYLKYIQGEIFICIPVVIENALVNSEGSVKNELARVIVHGLLHIIGYNDKYDHEITTMRNKEEEYLILLSER